MRASVCHVAFKESQMIIDMQKVQENGPREIKEIEGRRYGCMRHKMQLSTGDLDVLDKMEVGTRSRLSTKQDWHIASRGVRDAPCAGHHVG